VEHAKVGDRSIDSRLGRACSKPVSDSSGRSALRTLGGAEGNSSNCSVITPPTPPETPAAPLELGVSSSGVVDLQRPDRTQHLLSWERVRGSGSRSNDALGSPGEGQNRNSQGRWHT
jgi:hypothetical protein